VFCGGRPWDCCPLGDRTLLGTGGNAADARAFGAVFGCSYAALARKSHTPYASTRLLQANYLFKKANQLTYVSPD
jgi:hypothetical protein